MDDNNELIIYVLQQLRQGVPEAAVRNILAQNGWPQPLIDRAFSMVQQARPHQVDLQNLAPAPVQSQPVQPQPVELPKPTTDPYPIIEDEKKLEKRSNLRRRAFIATLIVVLLAGIAAAIFLVMQRMDNQPAREVTNKSTPSIDEQRKDKVDALADQLAAYYKAKGTYPTIAEINTRDFAGKEQGLDTTKQRDPKWNNKNTVCTDDEGRAIFAISRAEGCFTYRVTALNGEDCDAKTNKCTRVVVTANLEGNKPYIAALDRNNKE